MECFCRCPSSADQRAALYLTRLVRSLAYLWQGPETHASAPGNPSQSPVTTTIRYEQHPRTPTTPCKPHGPLNPAFEQVREEHQAGSEAADPPGCAGG